MRAGMVEHTADDRRQRSQADYKHVCARLAAWKMKPFIQQQDQRPTVGWIFCPGCAHGGCGFLQDMAALVLDRARALGVDRVAVLAGHLGSRHRAAPMADDAVVPAVRSCVDRLVGNRGQATGQRADQGEANDQYQSDQGDNLYSSRSAAVALTLARHQIFPIRAIRIGKFILPYDIVKNDTRGYSKKALRIIRTGWIDRAVALEVFRGTSPAGDRPARP